MARLAVIAASDELEYSDVWRFEAQRLRHDLERSALKS
jgi:hypothetical protein